MPNPRWPIPDRSLVALMAAQDRAAFEQLRARHAKSLYALAYQVLMDREAADWVVRDVFDHAWKRASLWTLASGRRSVGEWLSGLTRAGALAHVRNGPRLAGACKQGGM